jgi:hypothetical protein
MLTCLNVYPFTTKLKLKIISDMEPCHLQLLYIFFDLAILLLNVNVYIGKLQIGCNYQLIYNLHLESNNVDQNITRIK